MIDLLEDKYHPIGFFYNPNLYPKEEFFRRLKTAALVCKRAGTVLWVPPFEQARWLQTVRGLEREPEGGRRCEICIRHRLQVTLWVAEATSIPAFATTLTISPNKKSILINRIGSDLSKEHEALFLEADFKKKDGFVKSVQKSKALGLYRQDYCGCCYSMRGGYQAPDGERAKGKGSRGG